MAGDKHKSRTDAMGYFPHLVFLVKPDWAFDPKKKWAEMFISDQIRWPNRF